MEKSLPAKPDDVVDRDREWGLLAEFLTDADPAMRLGITRLTLSAGAALPAPANTPVNRTINSEGIGYGYTRTFSEGPTAVTISAPPPTLPDVLAVREGAARLRQGAAIDLGGIAKGWLADRLAVDLGANALVNLCGDLFARGGGEEGEGWPVGMGDQTVMLRDMGAATSGTRKRSWGEGLHHLIDPRTGLPSVTDVAEVSVLATTGADAEIFAKAALLLGSSAGTDFLRQHGALGWSFSP